MEGRALGIFFQYRSHCGTQESLPQWELWEARDPEIECYSHVLTPPSKVWKALPFSHWLKLVNELVSGTGEPAYLFSLLPSLPSPTLCSWHRIQSNSFKTEVRSCQSSASPTHSKVNEALIIFLVNYLFNLNSYHSLLYSLCFSQFHASGPLHWLLSLPEPPSPNTCMAHSFTSFRFLLPAPHVSNSFFLLALSISLPCSIF